jgi:hypothetical protein
MNTIPSHDTLDRKKVTAKLLVIEKVLGIKPTTLPSSIKVNKYK